MRDDRDTLETVLADLEQGAGDARRRKAQPERLRDASDGQHALLRQVERMDDEVARIDRETQG